MQKDFFKRKLSDLRHVYGHAEAKHFAENPFCENCDEKRIAVLTVHHTHGRKRSDVQTLCFNCHMIVHSPKSGAFTYADHLEFEKQKSAKKNLARLRDKIWIKELRSGKSQREVGRLYGVSHNTIRNAVLRNGR